MEVLDQAKAEIAVFSRAVQISADAVWGNVKSIFLMRRIEVRRFKSA
ncbi:hypothetical protein J8I87_11860 [Paraburkholderia sp. LEh10]|nr:hypothetical protein [Paraburkholderia sp. LEh10]MBP0590396.1 hypothetical protein [Paraburkholderia sp. LEh10]